MSSTLAKHDPVTLPRAREPRGWRWAAVLVAVLALHWVAGEWFERHRDTLAPDSTTRAPVQVALLTPQRIERKPASEAQRPAPATRASKPHAAAEHVLSAIRPDAAPKPAQTTAAAVPASGAAAANAPAASDAHAGNAQAAERSAGAKFSVPPSGELNYDTFYNGVQNQPGTIHWSSDGQTYEMVVAVPLPFVGTFSYSSHGRIDAFGLAPEQYIEKRGRRPEDVTIFNHATKQIAFTRTPATLALPDAAQDRFSVVMQLASLVRGDPDTYRPGVTRQFYVADNDSGQVWPIETIGDETVRTRGGFVTARHFMRLPRSDGDKRRIDVWLAPSLGWLPVRILQTEPNGTQFELLWRGKLAEPGTADAQDVQGTEDANSTVGPENSANSPVEFTHEKP
ncbi:DUF3108 domain-containing protein [Trinickia terrae]|uniref:DUF3108 domain-containing protein n=1 Tax=Trinickia terrae TaxID=2571161 RepID=A0A4U1I7W9_9BURK|nr:DUF3108 domain-containing protein [Trinickia terrae]TKC89518.1 DUF3108 domain-containing protein [Trinickia terrae]